MSDKKTLKLDIKIISPAKTLMTQDYPIIFQSAKSSEQICVFGVTHHSRVEADGFLRRYKIDAKLVDLCTITTKKVPA